MIRTYESTNISVACQLANPVVVLCFFPHSLQLSFLLFLPHFYFSHVNANLLSTYSI
ncbi:hypothetical protein, unlikely [Trypanosoma brucei brucei TREU927]|uniref:Uncharacterized protein n=1 Tax=Trypanosoma brucei brucei (strain 927/4 GUTat10.1) TaxID=185431 RepID=Q38FB3_TRYB2|nr:hypothetical protein, unlikely [Trypanosoma brucei brucei TREU927]EAN76507.1 hypothetical protein, unlikely [Trypanosoma brucei brucei TREU927]